MTNQNIITTKGVSIGKGPWFVWTSSNGVQVDRYDELEELLQKERVKRFQSLENKETISSDNSSEMFVS